MSSLHTQPHEVDIPITDLDTDPDVFSDQETNHLNNADYADDDDDDVQQSQLTMDQFDFEIGDYADPSSENVLSKALKGFKDMFAAKNGNRSDSLSYERVANGVGNGMMDSESLDSNDEVALHLKDYKINMLKRKLTRIGAYVFVMSICFFGAMAYMLFLLAGRGSATNKSYTDPDTGKTVLSNSTHKFYPTTLLISIDGLHPHYISASNTPTMHKLFVEKFGAPYMIPSFPSSTFPNHWTLVTGLFPSEHGIVGNTFYDPVLKKQFINTNPKVGGLDPEFWKGGEPVWTTAFKQGVNSAIHMWPGSEVPGIGIDGGGPLYVDKYNGSELLSNKVDRIFTWLDIEEIDKRPELVLTYVPTIDLYGHKFGISGSELVEALNYVDDFIDLIQLELKKRNLQDLVNMVIVSDHGMAPTSNNRLLYLDDIIDLNKIEHIDGWPLFGLRPKQEFPVDDIYDELKEKLSKQKHNNSFDVYKVQDIPAEFEFGGASSGHKFDYRLAPIWIIPHVGYSVTTKAQMEKNGGDYKPKGVHGYNNTELLMRAVFLAQGPYFDKLKSKKIHPFKNIEVYNLVCDTLEITPSPNNGTGDLSIFGATLPQSWKDNLVYPDLPFEVDHIIKDDATYDLLFRNVTLKEQETPTLTRITVSTNASPLESLIKEESTFTSVSEKLPKPTDFEVDLNHPEESDDHGDTKVPGIFQGLEDAFEDAVDSVGNFIDGAANKIDDLWHNVVDDN
ncbi:uncharacterized protein KQ657_002450 [Scheffersomyces spartinae]|uniref:Uncharacterized protein n=1 Tax=Scheffersomyces spartinae TaxID=45513 RepID=A0A9P7V6H4_9ASCO|nr:uncharacterized protein KQ657_002450 [Scheffersomyces spartinae]KAG7192090.1 hypothetical protein KQ657_002450 [Scheffersomyces spartinae]